MTTARGTEAILPVAHIMDRTVYGRQQDWEDSPTGLAAGADVRVRSGRRPRTSTAVTNYPRSMPA